MRTRTPTVSVHPTARRKSTSIAYVERVNRAIDHIVGHLAEPLNLKALARAAMLSPFHFHRVFQALMGETLADFVKRLRLERALAMMSHARPTRRSGGVPLSQIARSCGFSSLSDFSRCFKQRYGAPPSRFDLATWQKAHRGALEAIMPRAEGPQRLHRLPAKKSTGGDNPDGFKVRIRDLPARTVAYIRVRDPYKADAVVTAVHRLVSWAECRGLADNQWLGYQWENPELVPLEQCVYHAAVEVPPESFTPAGEIGRFRFPPMIVAQVEIRGGINLELRALQWLYGTWLPRSGYVPDDHPAFEAWIGRPFAHGMEHFELYAQLPVRRA
ncbi:MAG: AraC family transcriptional regulator [Phycisphaerales bacterium]